MRKIIILLSILYLLCPNQGLAQLDDIPVILIIPFDNATGQKKFNSLKKGMPDLLTAFLSPYHDKVAVIDRGIMEGIFTEKSLSWEGFTEENSLNQLGKLAQAKYLVRGSVSGKDNSFFINVFLYETETSRLLTSFESTDPEDNLTKTAQLIASQISEYFQANIKKVKDLENLSLDENPERSLNLIYGLGYYHNGQSELAMSYFMKILENDPKDELAHYWLGKSFLQAEMRDHARLEFEQYLKVYPQGVKNEDVINELKHIVNKKGVVNENQKINK